MPKPLSPRCRSRAERVRHGCRSQSGTDLPNSHTSWRHHIEWRRWDSNPRPPACKAGALPAELHPLRYQGLELVKIPLLTGITVARTARKLLEYMDFRFKKSIQSQPPYLLSRKSEAVRNIFVAIGQIRHRRRACRCMSESGCAPSPGRGPLPCSLCVAAASSDPDRFPKLCGAELATARAGQCPDWSQRLRQNQSAGGGFAPGSRPRLTRCPGCRPAAPSKSLCSCCFDWYVLLGAAGRHPGHRVSRGREPGAYWPPADWFCRSRWDRSVR